jgi:sarcosine oxidase, subunit gamma
MPRDREALTAGLESALAELAHSLVEVSQRQVAVRVSGPRASTILNTGCPLDLDPAAFLPGTCTRTLLGKAEIVIWRTGAEAFHLEMWLSYYDYVREYLKAAASNLPTDCTVSKARS